MAAPILWAPGILWGLSARKTSMQIKFLVLEGGYFGGFWEGVRGSANYIVMGACF